MSYLRIAISSDNHFDINHVNADDVVAPQVRYLREQGVALYVNTGDTYNDFRKTRKYFHTLQSVAGDSFDVRFLAGNHDMLRGADYKTIQGLQDPLYLHERSFVPPASPDTVIVGNNGWYDYSFVGPDAVIHPEYYWHWKKAFWVDSTIDQPGSDQERMEHELGYMRIFLRAHVQTGQKVLFVSHFVPEVRILPPAMLRDPKGEKLAAMLGSQRMGELLQEFHVDAAAFGHWHRRDEPRTIGSTTFYHRPVGYGTKRRAEWVTDDFMTEWQNSLTVIDL